MRILTPKEVQNSVSLKKAYLLDIREKYERDICKLCTLDALHIPMGEVVSKINELPKEKDLILMCKTGKRAEAMANFLEVDHNFSNLAIMKDGIMGWIEEIESNLERY